ncbi:MAG: hypothetical protein AB7V61_07655, partial [Methylocystis sp.]
MTEIGFDSQSQGVVAGHMQGAYVGCASGSNALPIVMARKVVGDTTAKIIRLADIHRVPSQIWRELTEYVDSGSGIVAHADRVKLEIIFCFASAPP